MSTDEYALEPDERLFRAGELLAAVFGDRMTAHDVGEHMTCSEAENVAEALLLAGQPEAAETWIEGHAAGDDDPDDLHYQGDEGEEAEEECAPEVAERLTRLMNLD